MSMFANAKTIETKVSKPKGSNKTEIAMAGIQSLAEIQAMIKSLTAVSKTLETEIKEAGFEQFLAMETKVRPDSFKGTDGMATCSVEMRKRSTMSALNEDECNLLEQIGLTPKKDVVQIEMYGINPEFAGDGKLMEKVSKALEKIVPDGFIVHQQEVSKMVVSEELLNAAFALEHGSDNRKTALTLCTTMALKPKLNEDYDMAMLGDNVAKLINVVEDTVAELEAEGAKMVVAAEAAPKAPRKTRKTAVAA